MRNSICLSILLYFHLTICGFAATPGLESLNILKGWQNTSGTFVTAIEVRLKEGWKTYWRVPGAAGLAPIISFSGSKNIASHRFQWPAPIVFGPKGLKSIGYKDRLILPLILTPLDKTADIELTLSGQIGICDDICIPLEFSLQQSLSTKTRKRDPKIVAALASAPPVLATKDPVACKIKPDGKNLKLDVRLKTPVIGGDEMLVIEYNKPNYQVNNIVTNRRGDELRSKATFKRQAGAMQSLARSDILLSLISASKAFDLGTCAG